MESNEFEIGSRIYRAKALDARTQFHVARRLGVLMAPLIQAQEDLGEMTAEAVAGPLFEALSEVPDKKLDYVLDACLGAAEVKQDGGLGWSPLHRNGVTMYPINMLDMLKITAQVILVNLGSFTGALPAGGQLAGLMDHLKKVNG